MLKAWKVAPVWPVAQALIILNMLLIFMSSERDRFGHMIETLTAG